MNGNGFYLYVEYGEKFRRMSDAQLGALVRALMQYKSTGEAPEIDDLAVGIAFDIVRQDIDKQAEAYQKKKEAGAKGGSKGKQTEANASKPKQTEAEESKPKQTEAEESKPKQTEANGTNKKENKKEKEKENKTPKGDNHPLTPSFEELAGERTISEPVLDAVKEWMEYKKERHEPYKPAGMKALFAQIEAKEQEYGASAVIDIIRESMSNGWRGIIWDRLKKPQKEQSLAEKWGLKDTDIFNTGTWGIIK